MKTTILTFATIGLIQSTLSAAYVTPTLGGGEYGGQMIMPRVMFDGTDLSVPSIDRMMPGDPVLRPLTLPNEFDPSKNYFSALSNRAYNREYGWFPHDDIEPLPANNWIWIELVSQTTGLKTYEQSTYNPIFGTDGSDSKWRWEGGMVHNAYTVAPQIGNFSATYRLYIGDSVGAETSGYGDTTVTLNWTSIPEPTTLGVAGMLGGMLLRRRRYAGK